jgi:hypothetical protein
VRRLDGSAEPTGTKASEWSLATAKSPLAKQRLLRDVCAAAAAATAMLAARSPRRRRTPSPAAAVVPSLDASPRRSALPLQQPLAQAPPIAAAQMPRAPLAPVAETWPAKNASSSLPSRAAALPVAQVVVCLGFPSCEHLGFPVPPALQAWH